MKPSKSLYLRRFYGSDFNRELGKSCPDSRFKRIPIQDHETLIKLYLAYQDRGCDLYLSVYDYNHKHPIPSRKPKPDYVYPYQTMAIVDRIFLDFDKDLSSEAQKEYDDLLSQNSKQGFYKRLIQQGQATDPIMEAIKVYEYILDNFQGDPTLIFSGAKGCHLYIFFEPVVLQNPKETLKHFINVLEDKLGLSYLDPAVKGDLGRVARIPTSKHPKTGLYAHPFKHSMDYSEIIQNSESEAMPFDDLDIIQARSNIHDLLLKIDTKLSQNKEALKYKRLFNKPKLKLNGKTTGKVSIQSPEDILKLNNFRCFQNLPYTHDSRLILANICKWSGLTAEDTLEALEVFCTDKGYYDASKHLHNVRQIRGLKKYVFTCNTMKNKGLCPNTDFCKEWFYLKLDLSKEFEDILNSFLDK